MGSSNGIAQQTPSKPASDNSNASSAAMHADIKALKKEVKGLKDKRNVTDFGVDYQGHVSGLHGIGFRYLPLKEGLGLDGGAAFTPDGKRFAGRFGVTATGRVTDSLFLTAGVRGSVGVDATGSDPRFNGSGTFHLSARYVPTHWLQVTASAAVNASGAGHADSATIQAAGQDLLDRGGKLASDFVSDVQDMLNGISPSLQQALQTEVNRQMALLQAQLPAALTSALLGGGNMTQVSALVSSAIGAIMSAVPDSLQAEATVLKQDLSVRFDKLKVDTEALFKENGRKVEQAMHGSYSISADGALAVRLTPTLWQSSGSDKAAKLYAIAGLGTFMHLPIAGTSTTGALPTDLDASALRFGGHAELGLGTRVPGTYVHLEGTGNVQGSLAKASGASAFTAEPVQIYIGARAVLRW